MSIYEKLQEGINNSLSNGFEASKHILEKAKTGAVELEEISILKLDLRKLNARKKELISELGVKVYEAFIINEKKSLTQSSMGIGEFLDELKNLDEQIAEKERALKIAE